MSNIIPFPRSLDLPIQLGELILDAAEAIARKSGKAFRVSFHRPISGSTLRPGRETPLWNELRAQLRPHLTRRGDQVNLGRILGLPRQRVNEFVTRGSQMPDAERTLQLLAWLIAMRQRRRPA